MLARPEPSRSGPCPSQARAGSEPDPSQGRAGSEPIAGRVGAGSEPGRSQSRARVGASPEPARSRLGAGGAAPGGAADGGRPASDHRKPFSGTTLTLFFASDYDAGFEPAPLSR